MTDNLYISFLNLAHRTDRLAHMEKQLAAAGLEAIRFSGEVTKDKSWESDYTRVMFKRSPGAIGCYYGQMEIMNNALRAGKNALVLEDDVVFCADFQKRLAYLDAFCEANPWDVIWLGGTVHVNPPWWHRANNPELPGTIMRRDAECTADPRILRTYGAFSTYAYIVNLASIKKILIRLTDVMPESMGIDWSFIKIQPELLTYMFVPGCCKQMDNQSDIGNGITYFSGFSKLGPYWWKNYLEDFNPETHNWAEAKISKP